MTQHEQYEPIERIVSSLPHLVAWLSTWPNARAEFQALIAEYRGRYPASDTGRLELLVETTDRNLYELHHRLAWLERQLELSPAMHS